MNEEAAELKKQSDWFKKTPLKNNRRNGKVSADSPEAIKKMAPAFEAEAKKANDVAIMFDQSKRAGAGGTKAGVVGIRPNGGKAASTWLDKYTGIGRMALRKPVPTRFDGSSIDPKLVKRPSVVIYDRCMDCMKPVTKDECIPDMGYVLPTQKEMFQGVRLKEGDVICSFTCTPCATKAKEACKSKNYLVIVQTLQGPQEMMASQVFMEERAKRIFFNKLDYIRAERNKPETDMFYGDARDPDVINNSAY